MTNWTQKPRLGFDTETTGINIYTDRIVTCSLIYTCPLVARPKKPFLSGAIQELSNTTYREKKYWIINPGIPIPQAATRVHGITTEQAVSQGQNPKNALEEIASLISSHMNAGNPLIAYNAGFDLSILNRELERNNLIPLTQRLIKISPVIDPYYLDKYLDKYRRGPRKLQHLLEHYCSDNERNFHNAEADVYATLDIVDAMIAHYEQLKNTSLDTIQEYAHIAHTDTVTYFKRKAEENGTTNDDSFEWPIA
ncbi:MAG: DNA polymerase III subunit epsilon [Actinomycetaceae bacterium]|nr:DNA polymerase III subunit epsilon [Actinomycetaceae bacterium]